MKRMNEIITVLAVLLLLAGGGANGAAIMDFDFDSPAHDSMAKLTALGWTFGGETTPGGQAEESIFVQNGEKTLMLDPGTPTDTVPYGTKKPQAKFKWSRAITVGKANFRWSHNSSFSNTQLSFIDSTTDTELFRVGLNDDEAMNFVGAETVSYLLLDNTNKPTSVTIVWTVNSDGTAGSFTYSAGLDKDGKPIEGTIAFAAAGKPDSILYILTNDTHHDRVCYLYDIKVVEKVGILAETNGCTEVDEEGTTTDTFTIALTKAPSAGKVVDVTFKSGDPNEFDFTINPKILSFTTGNWSLPQTVTVKAVDDALMEGTETFAADFLVGGTDPDFAGQYIDLPLTVTVLDDERGRLRIVESSGSTAVSEQGATSDSYTIALSRQPVQDVTVDIAADTGQMTLSTSQIVFNGGNWNIPVTVTATAIDDTVGEDDPQRVDITHTITSTDPAYEGLSPVVVAANIRDNDCTPARSLPHDINGDCVTNLEDFAILAADWLRCTLPNVPGCL